MNDLTAFQAVALAIGIAAALGAFALFIMGEPDIE